MNSKTHPSLPFTVNYGRIVREPITNIRIFPSATPNIVDFIDGLALWDTGASHSAIDENLAQKLGLL